MRERKRETESEREHRLFLSRRVIENVFMAAALLCYLVLHLSLSVCPLLDMKMNKSLSKHDNTIEKFELVFGSLLHRVQVDTIIVSYTYCRWFTNVK